MTNKDLFRAACKKKRKTYGDVATLLGISRQALYKKLDGHIPFKAAEIKKISDYLELNTEEVDNIFLN